MGSARVGNHLLIFTLGSARLDDDIGPLEFLFWYEGNNERSTGAISVQFFRGIPAIDGRVDIAPQKVSP